MSESHKTDMPFRPRLVPRDDVDLRTAKFWKRGAGAGLTYYGRTTCPQCFAPDIEGFNIIVSHNLGGPGDDIQADAVPPIDEEPEGPVEIPFECSCAAEHQKDKTGCGATWICVWKDQG